MSVNTDFNKRIGFSIEINQIINKIITDFVSEDKKEDCRNFVNNEFNKIPNFTNKEFIENAKSKHVEISLINLKKLKEEKKIRIKEELENSILNERFINFEYPDFSNIEICNCETAIHLIKFYDNKTRIKHTEIILYEVLKGGYLKRIKFICSISDIKFIPLLLSNGIKEPQSLIYFYIQLYEFCLIYPKLQYLAKSLNYLKTNFKIIKEIVQESEDFWK